MIVDERAVAGALRVLHEAPQRLSAATYDARKAEAMLKVRKALEMKRHNGLALAAQEREANASEAYKQAIDEDASASSALIALKASIDAAKITIDIWRTESATERASYG